MATGAGVALVGGTVLSTIGELEAAKARSRARRAEAEDRRRRAQEVLERGELTAEALRLEAQQLTGEQQVQAIAVRAGESTTLRFLADTERKLTRQLLLNRKEAEFRAEQLLRGAETQERLAKEERKAGRFRAAGRILAGAGQLGLRGT